VSYSSDLAIGTETDWPAGYIRKSRADLVKNLPVTACQMEKKTHLFGIHSSSNLEESAL
jgi:hypothetical protein